MSNKKKKSLAEGMPDIDEGRSIDEAFSESLRQGLAKESVFEGLKQLLGQTAAPSEEVPSGQEVAEQYNIPEKMNVKIPFTEKEYDIPASKIAGWGLENVSPLDITPMGPMGRIDDVARGAGKGIKVIDDMAEQLAKRKLGKVAVKPETSRGFGKVIQRGIEPKGFGKVIQIPGKELAEKATKETTSKIAEKTPEYEKIRDFLKRIKRD